MQTWLNVCQAQADYSNECSLEAFDRAAANNWSEESLSKANTTREVRMQCPAQSLPAAVLAVSHGRLLVARCHNCCW